LIFLGVLRFWTSTAGDARKIPHGGRPYARDPERSEKIAAAKRGKPRPAHVREAIGRAQVGRVITEKTRRKMSEAQKRRDAWPPAAGRPWTEAEDAVVLTLWPRRRRRC
jgi:hypothetical protein